MGGCWAGGRAGLQRTHTPAGGTSIPTAAAALAALLAACCAAFSSSLTHRAASFLSAQCNMSRVCAKRGEGRVQARAATHMHGHM